tara:strand:+ start:373 stop:1029 length:657 start_codon:yes stop_codon:yes gene_type:complete
MKFDNIKYKEIKEYFEKNNKNPNTKPMIIAISKNKPLELIEEAIEQGVRVFGENRVQEAVSKFSTIKDKNIDKNVELHLTGPLQRNKVKEALKVFDVFQTLDRENLALEFKKYLLPEDKKKFFIQVNIGDEKQKSGISIKSSNEFIKFCNHDLKINIIGLMCIPPLVKDPTTYFIQLKKIATQNNLKYLSMGMSADYKFAIHAGATHIRIGTLLFGRR